MKTESIWRNEEVQKVVTAALAKLVGSVSGLSLSVLAILSEKLSIPTEAVFYTAADDGHGPALAQAVLDALEECGMVIQDSGQLYVTERGARLGRLCLAAFKGGKSRPSVC